MTTGFFRAKTRSLIGMANRLVDAYGGEVPGTVEGPGRRSRASDARPPT